jgi:hypothetical protein
VTLGSIQITSVAATSARRTLSLSEANLDVDINVDMGTEDERILGEIFTLPDDVPVLDIPYSFP